ncbi:MAG: DNA polymerase III subunit alpha [SAR86 cluster bacterium]|uniref:DNA polymerase III subunit alpha n=1 Tax=SAR86 cluster bacterium TaxID=2030880 RepID=A0A2A4XBT5_9GAMM|nr:MAG: DNA polymerase III subunit alpha [SAR86 cluster bacterium]
MSANLPNQPFAHLRLHTEFSINDGLVTIKPLIARLRELSMPAVAVTDLANMFSLIKFYSASLKAGIKPVCGCDVLVESDDRSKQTRLVLLVKNEVGYLSLTKLVSELYTENPSQSEPVVRKSQLAGRVDGLIAISGAQNSDIGLALLAEDKKLAKGLLDEWQQLFPESFYLELQRVGRAEEEDYIDAAVALAIETNTPVVATNDVRFIDQDDFDAHEVRVCINERRTLDDSRRPHNYTDQQYLKTGTEMAELFSDIPEALENAWEIVKRCNLSLVLDQPCLPNYPVPEGKGMEEYFSELSSDGLRERLRSLYGDDYETKDVEKPYWERLEFELGVINQMGFAGYFLIVMEFIQWSKDNDIPVGPGRGSGAGSIVAYALRITDLDPLKYDLLFERFLNPERVSMPDFDVDFCIEGRDRVIQHVAELYGKDAVSQIITFGTMAAKAVVRDVARVQGKPYALADKLSKLIPFEPGITLKKAFEAEPLLGEFVDSDEDAQEIMEMAYKLEGITRNVGKHAGGVVIAPTKLTDFTPLYCDEAGQGLVTQFDKNDVETAGLVKFDFLGLRTLTIIDWAVKMINDRAAEGEPLVDITKLPLTDERVYRLLQKGETTAVFQLESRGMKDLIKRQVPSSFEDIIALVALFRPGPLQSGMVDDFIDRKHGRTQVVYPHEELAPVLGNTYGVILYQEQVMQIAQVLANYSLAGADILRKAMGKKNPEVMAKQRTLFQEGAEARGIDADLAASIFDLMEKFAGYGFNKSHSAAYALVSYQTAWLKTHYPACFMAAVLTAEMQNTDKIVTLIDECRSMKLVIVPPDINRGQFNFTVNENDEIVYGLGAIKGLGEGPVGSILAAREERPFTNLLDICQRVDTQNVNKRTMQALIRSGALDNMVEGELDYARALLSALLPQAMQAAEQSSRNQASGVEDMFGEIAPAGTEDADLSASNITVRAWAEQHRLKVEKETLGLWLSGHPIDEFLDELSHITKNRLVNLRPERGPQTIAGVLHSIRTMRNKAGDTIAFLVLDDSSARFEFSLFAKEYEKYRETLQKDVIMVVECTVSIDDYSGSMRGRGKSVMTLSEARKRNAHRVALNLESESLGSDFCEHLARILEPYRKPAELLEEEGSTAANGLGGSSVPGISHAHSHPGQLPPNDHTAWEAADAGEGCQVMVRYQRSDSIGCIMLGQEWVVSPADDLIQRLRLEYGKDKVVLSYK